MRLRDLLRGGSIGLVAPLVVAACADTPADVVRGRVTKIVDGDSFEIGAVAIRLRGVDAFEGRQSCGLGAAAWACGKAGATKLAELVGSDELACEKVEIDDYGRVVAACRRGELDLGAEIVRAGLALAYRRYDHRYVAVEEEACRARRGAWQSTFVAPWDERRGERRAHAAPCAAAAPSTATGAGSPNDNGSTCAEPRIKGNVNRNGARIYHVPGSRSYDNTVIDTARGERWFCSEADAVHAGWRAPGG